MPDPRSTQMVERLRSMQAAAPDIEASAVVSVDGLIMASALATGRRRGSRLSHVGRYAQPGRTDLRRVGSGHAWSRSTSRVAPGAIVLTSVGAEAVLTALARHEAKLGLIFLEMRRAAEDISKLVG